jgi:hypothetical protein
MKSSNPVRLRLEVLEARLALNGTFRGAINAPPPSRTPFPFNGMTVQTTTAPQPGSGFRDAFTDFSFLSFVPASTSQSQGQVFPSPSIFQSQVQSLQAIQTAMIDRLFTEMVSMLQLMQSNVPLI